MCLARVGRKIVVFTNACIMRVDRASVGFLKLWSEAVVLADTTDQTKRCYQTSPMMTTRRRAFGFSTFALVCQAEGADKR